MVQPHWDQFTTIILVENHRQEGDAEYANILNRIRVGELTQEDIQILRSQVKPQSHQDIKEGTVIACKHKVVNKYNRLCLDQIDKELFRNEAINSHSNIPNYKPVAVV